MLGAADAAPTAGVAAGLRTAAGVTAAARFCRRGLRPGVLPNEDVFPAGLDTPIGDLEALLLLLVAASPPEHGSDNMLAGAGFVAFLADAGVRRSCCSCT